MIRNLFAGMSPFGLITGTFMFFNCGIAVAQIPPLYGTISGKVWEEQVPVNGVFDPSETTYSGFLVRMLTTTTPVRTVASAIVDANGNYVLNHYEGPGTYLIQLYYPQQAFLGLAQTAATLPGSQSHFTRLGNNTTVTTTVSAPGQNIVRNAALIRNPQYRLSCTRFSGAVTPSTQQQLSMAKFDYNAAGVFLLDLNLWTAVSSFHDHVVIEESQNHAAQMQTRVGLQTIGAWPGGSNMNDMFAQAATNTFVAPVNAGEIRHFYNVNNSAVLPLSNLNFAPVNTGAGSVTVPVTLANSVTITGAMNFIVTSLPNVAACGTCLVYYTTSPLNRMSLNGAISK